MGEFQLNLIQAPARDALREFPENSAHCVVTSPPYYGLRDYGADGQIGLEESVQDYVSELVEIFREVKRVLRPEGTVWLVIGDSYVNTGCDNTKVGGFTGESAREYAETGEGGGSQQGAFDKTGSGIPEKNLLGVPWRVAFALQDDGWWLRNDIIWSKPNPIPESVKDRCTLAHEYIFLLSQNPRYYYDNDAIREPFADARMGNPGGGGQYGEEAYGDIQPEQSGLSEGEWLRGPALGGKNKRTVWEVSKQPFPDAHFAVYPPALIEPCIKAGTSDYGCCPECGAPWERITETEKVKVSDSPRYEGNDDRRDSDDTRAIHQPVDWHWEATCDCYEQGKVDANETERCTVLDPFMGAGTTAMVAKQYGRHAMGCDLKQEYLDMARERCASVTWCGKRQRDLFGVS